MRQDHQAKHPSEVREAGRRQPVEVTGDDGDIGSPFPSGRDQLLCGQAADRDGNLFALAQVRKEYAFAFRIAERNGQSQRG